MVYYNIKKNKLLLKLFDCLLITVYVFMFLFGSFVSATDTNTITFFSSQFNKDIDVILPNDVGDYFLITTSYESYSWGGRIHCVLYYSNSPFIIRTNGSNYFISSSINNDTIFYRGSYDLEVTSRPVVNYIPNSFNMTNVSYSTLTYTNFNFSALSFSNHDITDPNGNVVFQGTSLVKNPEVTTSMSDLGNLSVNGISISANSWSEEDLYILFYNTSFNNSINSRTEPLQKFLLVPYLAQNIANPFYDPINSTSTNIQYYIPISNLGFPLNIGNTYEIRFATIESYVDPIDVNNYYNYYNFLGDPYSFTISNNVSQDIINNINQNIALETEKNYNEELNNSINNQTNSINNINNSITDTNIDSTFDLPSDSTQDITQNGINNIFTTIYNSFTSGTAQDIVFPIPFTERSITLQANYNLNMLSNNGLSWVVSFIRVFWWYYIGRFIITDIANKIKKIKSGDVENVENNNIRSDML